MTVGRRLLGFLAVLVSLAGGCGREDGDAVVVYTSVDSAYARQVLDRFERETGIAVRALEDTEATKSVGLAQRLRAERDRPSADVWWGNEAFYTIGLAKEGFFTPHEPAGAADIRPQFRDAGGLWHGSGLRARVVAAADDVPVEVTTLAGLADAARAGVDVVIARPTAGTTGSHAAALYVVLGQDAADALFRDMHVAGVRLVGSNAQTAEAVATGGATLGLTDNDDVAAARRNLGTDVRTLILDQQAGGIGTLTIPTTVALVDRPRDATRDANARRLIDYLTSPEAEALLMELEFTVGSVRDADTLRSMEVDNDAVAAMLPEAIRRATALLEGREP